jgi:hypothetical protein
MPQWLRSTVGANVDRGYPLLGKVVGFVLILLIARTAYARRLSPLDGAIKVGGILGWWLFGIWYLERLLSPGDDSGDKRHVGRRSPMDGANKADRTSGWWFFGNWYRERLLSPEDDSDDEQHG